MISIPTSFTDELADLMNDLVRTNLDSYEGFREAAHLVEDEHLKATFRKIAGERLQQAEELRARIREANREPVNHGSALGVVHRRWIELRATMAGNSSQVVLEEAQRGEEFIQHRYEDALVNSYGEPLDQLLHDQYQRIRNSHEVVRNMLAARQNQPDAGAPASAVVTVPVE